MTYYIEQEGQIKLHDTDRARLERTLQFMPQYAEATIQETQRPIENCRWADTEEYIAQKQHDETAAQVASLEASTGLVRPLREAITAGQIPVSSYVLMKVQEIDSLAQGLRSTQGEEYGRSK